MYNIRTQPTSKKSSMKFMSWKQDGTAVYNAVTKGSPESLSMQ